MNKNIIKNSGTFLSSVLLGLMAFYLALEIFVPTMTLPIFGFKPYRVITTSMEPVINRGDLVIDGRFDISALQPNDIITFEADVDYDGDRDIVTHYVYSITGNETEGYIIRTIRQAGITADPWILTEDDIIGRYLFHIPFVGYVAEFVQTPLGIVVIVIDGIALVAIILLLSYKKSSKV